MIGRKGRNTLTWDNLDFCIRRKLMEDEGLMDGKGRPTRRITREDKIMLVDRYWEELKRNKEEVPQIITK